MSASGQYSLSDKTIDELIQKYLNEVIEEIKKSKFRKEINIKKLILNFYHIKLRFYDYIAKEYDVDYFYFRALLKQIEVITFWGIGLDDSIEKHITNNKLFWGLFKLYIKVNDFPSFNLEYIAASVNRYERLKAIDLEKALGIIYIQQCEGLIRNNLEDYGCFLADATLENIKKDLSHDSIFLNHSNFTVQESNKGLSKITDAEGDVLVYRGFDFGPGKDVRKDSKKIDNENAHIQETGLGVSFTGNKKVARQFALNKWEAMNIEVSTTWDNRIKSNYYILKRSNLDIDTFLSDKVRNAAIGTYKVNKKDILLNLIAGSDLESELVILPEKLNLIDYRIIKTTKLK